MVNDASTFDSPEFYKSVNMILQHDSYIYDDDINSELFSRLDSMYDFDQNLGKVVGCHYQEQEYRLVEWRAW